MQMSSTSIHQYDEIPNVQDILYFKIGQHGLVCFHGNHFHISKRISSDLLNEWIQKPNIFKVHTDYFVNILHITNISQGKVYFQQFDTIEKNVPITKLRQYRLQQMLHERRKRE